MRSIKHAHLSTHIGANCPASSKKDELVAGLMFNPHTRKTDLASAFSLEMEADS